MSNERFGEEFVQLAATWEPLEIDLQTQPSKRTLWNNDISTEPPQMPLNAYQLFVRATRPSLSGNIGEIAKQLSALWSSLPCDQRNSFDEAAKEGKRLYDEKFANYKRSASYQKSLAELRNRGTRC